MNLNNDDIVKEWENEKKPIEEKMNDDIDDAFSLNKDIIKYKQDRKKNFDAMKETDYFFCVYFRDNSERKKFLDQVKWPTDGTTYINGRDLAKHLNIKI